MLALWRLLSPGQPDWTALEISELAPEGLQVLSALGARYLMLPAGIALPATFEHRLRTVYTGTDATILENAGAAPRARVASTVLATDGEAATDQAIAEPTFDARTMAAVERAQPGTSPPPGAHGTVAVVRREDARVTLRARLDRRGLVVLDEALLPGWSVRVDGRPAPALRVDDVMRGVIVPAGQHRIVWSYAVPGLRVGALVSLLTLVALAGGALALGGRSRRSLPGAAR